MLVLSRRSDEAIMIGEDVEIVVVDIRGDKVRLGVNAPPRVAVHRKEIFEAIRLENANAATLRGSLGLTGASKAPPTLASVRAEAIRSIAAGRVSA
jgi:carbon storage regulator